MIELGNHHLTVLYEFVDPDTEHLWLPTYKKRGNWTLCAFGLKKNKTPLITIHIFSMHLGLPGVLQTGNPPDANSQSHLPGRLARTHR